MPYDLFVALQVIILKLIKSSFEKLLTTYRKHANE